MLLFRLFGSFIRKGIPLILLLSFFIACRSKNENISIKKDEKAINKAINTSLDVWHQSASESDFKTYFDVMDTASVFIGTDATENWTKEAFSLFSKPYFDKGEAWSFHPKERNIYLSKSGDVAWFDELLDTWMGTCRGSGVFELDEAEWKLKHYVFSLTVPNDAMNDVIELIASDNE